MDRRVLWYVATVLAALVAHPHDASADPPATWSVAWRRTCRRDLGVDAQHVDEREVAWCYAHFDTRSGRYLRPQSVDEIDERTEGPARSPEVPTGYTLVSECDEDSALVRRRGRFEVRVRGQTRPAWTQRRGLAPTSCARSDDGSQLAVTTTDGVTTHARRGAGYVATARWTERGLAAVAFVDHGDTLLGWRSDETLLTAWRVGAPAVERGLPMSDTPRSYACAPGGSSIEWMPFLTAYDVGPRAPRAEHGLLGVCDGADVYATDAAEFTDQGADDRRWARAVAERYEMGGMVQAPRVWRAPWGDRVAAWSVRRPYVILDFAYDVRVVEHDGTLYRVEMETLHDGPADRESFPRARYEVALDRGRMETLLRAMFDPRGLRRRVSSR